MSSSPIEPDPSSTQTFGVADVVDSVDSPVVGLSQQDAAAIAALLRIIPLAEFDPAKFI